MLMIDLWRPDAGVECLLSSKVRVDTCSAMQLSACAMQPSAASGCSRASVHAMQWNRMTESSSACTNVYCIHMHPCMHPSMRLILA